MSDRTPPPLLPADLEGIPDELTTHRQWLTWRAEWNPKRERWDKIPTNPRTGANASTTNQRTWGTFTEACTAWLSGRTDGIGFVFTQDDPYCGIDLDNKANACRDPETGELAPWAAAIVKRLDSYTEPSVSGTGLHIIMRGTLPEGAGSRIASHEAYQHKRFFAFTGRPLPGYAVIHERTATLAAWHAETTQPKTTPLRHEPAHTIASEDSVILERVRRTEKGRRLLAGNWETDYPGKRSEGDMALADLIRGAGADDEQGERLFGEYSLCAQDRPNPAYYIRHTWEKALAHVTPWTQPTAPGTRHSPPSTNPPLAAAAIDPTSCPVQLAEALARIAELERENHMLRKVLSGQASIRRNRGLGTSRNVALGIVNLLAHRESAGTPPEDRMYQIPILATAEASGCSDDTATEHTNRLASAGLVRREIREVPIERVDTTSGELFITMEPRQFLGMPEDCENVIDLTERLARADLNGPKHGGQRTPCPKCGEIAGQRVTRTVRCLGCGHETSTTVMILPAITEATPQDADTVTEESTDGVAASLSATPPRKMRGGETPESPRVDSVTQKPHLAGWGESHSGAPPSGSVAATWMTGGSLHFDTDVRPTG